MPAPTPPPGRFALKNLRRILGIDGPAMRVLRQDLSTLHITTQLLRFIRLSAMYFTAHAVFPAGTTGQAIGVLAATSAEAAFQQMFPQLAVGRVLAAIVSSPALCRYLASLHPHSVSGAPATMPITVTEPPVPDTSVNYHPVVTTTASTQTPEDIPMIPEPRTEPDTPLS